MGSRNSCRRTVDGHAERFSIRRDKAAEFLAAVDIMAGRCLDIERIAHADRGQIDIAGLADNHLAIRIDLRIQIYLAVEYLSRIVREARGAQQGRGARARDQRFGVSGHWKLLFGKRESGSYRQPHW